MDTSIATINGVLSPVKLYHSSTVKSAPEHTSAPAEHTIAYVVYTSVH